MNRMAVALAADSAVTVNTGASYKLRDSGLKVFMLSKQHPVGVMVYNNASLVGVPWETIIKLYRETLMGEPFDTLEEYGENLICFIDNNTDLFPSNVQRSYYLDDLHAEFTKIYDAAASKLWQRIQYGTDPGEEPRKLQIECAEHAIRERVQSWREKNGVELFDSDLDKEGDGIDKKVVGSLSGEVNRLVEDLAVELFPESSVTSNLIGPLWELARLLVAKDDLTKAPHLMDSYSGLVIAGFGDRQHLPELKHYRIGGVYEDRLKYVSFPNETVSEHSPAVVRAFAYTNMVEGFLQGITSDVLEQLVEAILKLREMPLAVIDFIDDLSEDQKKIWKERVRVASEREAAEFSNEVLLREGLIKSRVP